MGVLGLWVSVPGGWLGPLIETDRHGYPFEVDALDADTVLALASDIDTQIRVAERAKLNLVARWCELHPARTTTGTGTRDPGAHATWGETGEILECDEPLGGDGCPLVAAFCAEDLAAALSMSPAAAVRLLADALNLVHRLKRTWHRVQMLQRELVTLRDPHCVFPWCLHPSDDCDLDHIEPYDPGTPEDPGPPGQTSPEDLAPSAGDTTAARPAVGGDTDATPTAPTPGNPPTAAPTSSPRTAPTSSTEVGCRRAPAPGGTRRHPGFRFGSGVE